MLSGYLDDWENISFEDERKATDGLILIFIHNISLFPSLLKNTHTFPNPIPQPQHPARKNAI
ncbi:hypothetical protein D3Z45_06140 [Lachnospiraceae bacterium]|nr:hypothetical protein [Lachnospiraceae bacterium]